MINWSVDWPKIYQRYSDWDLRPPLSLDRLILSIDSFGKLRNIAFMKKNSFLRLSLKFSVGTKPSTLYIMYMHFNHYWHSWSAAISFRFVRFNRSHFLSPSPVGSHLNLLFQYLYSSFKFFCIKSIEQFHFPPSFQLADWLPVQVHDCSYWFPSGLQCWQHSLRQSFDQLISYFAVLLSVIHFSRVPLAIAICRLSCTSLDRVILLYIWSLDQINFNISAFAAQFPPPSLRVSISILAI